MALLIISVQCLAYRESCSRASSIVIGINKKLNKTINDSKAAILEAHNAIYVIKTDYPVKQSSELAAGECLIKLEYTSSGFGVFGLHNRNADWAKKKPSIWLSSGCKIQYAGFGCRVFVGEKIKNSHLLEVMKALVVIGAHYESTVRFGDRVGFKWFSNVSHSFNYGYLFSVLIIGFTVFQVIV